MIDLMSDVEGGVEAGVSRSTRRVVVLRRIIDKAGKDGHSKDVEERLELGQGRMCI